MATDFSGTWKNQNGSTLELIQSNMIITGRFESGVGDDGLTLWVDISGRAQGDVITFNALYSKYATVVTWAGQLTVDAATGKDSLRTQWLHVSEIADDQEHSWMWFSNRIGSDVFTRA